MDGFYRCPPVTIKVTSGVASCHLASFFGKIWRVLAHQNVSRANRLKEKNLYFSKAAENVTNSGKPEFGCNRGRGPTESAALNCFNHKR